MTNYEIHDLDILQPPKECIKLGNKEIEISNIPAGKALKILKDYQYIEQLQENPEELKKLETKKLKGEELLWNMSLDVCLGLIKNKFSIFHLGKWFKTISITKKWLLKFNMKQIIAFLDIFKNAVLKSFDSGVKKK